MTNLLDGCTEDRVTGEQKNANLIYCMLIKWRHNHLTEKVSKYPF